LFFTAELFTGKLLVSYHPAGGKNFWLVSYQGHVILQRADSAAACENDCLNKGTTTTLCNKN
jgi:hypothetical protein